MTFKIKANSLKKEIQCKKLYLEELITDFENLKTEYEDPPNEDVTYWDVLNEPITEAEEGIKEALSIIKEIEGCLQIVETYLPPKESLFERILKWLSF
ncbi:MAG TPA: hypothetical protein V6C96_01355 [Vampirovibrionales bacterium]